MSLVTTSSSSYDSYKKTKYKYSKEVLLKLRYVKLSQNKPDFVQLHKILLDCWNMDFWKTSYEAKTDVISGSFRGIPDGSQQRLRKNMCSIPIYVTPQRRSELLAKLLGSRKPNVGENCELTHLRETGEGKTESQDCIDEFQPQKDNVDEIQISPSLVPVQKNIAGVKEEKEIEPGHEPSNSESMNKNQRNQKTYFWVVLFFVTIFIAIIYKIN